MTLHIIGAGMAGLAAAVAATKAGRRVIIHESANHAGGRCRSFHDAGIDRVIDNGNHLLLSGNRTVLGFAATVGGLEALYQAPAAAFPFVDLADGTRWSLRPGKGRLPLWLLDPARRVPGTTLGDYLPAIRLAFAKGRTLDRYVAPGGTAWRRFWEPLAVAVLNTAADQADVGLMWPVMLETFFKGEAACRPVIAKRGLSEALVAPALDWLGRFGAEIHFGQRLRRLERGAGRATALHFDDQTVTLSAADRVILALPPHAAGPLLPELVMPTAFRTIVNGHFRVPARVAEPGEPRLMGVVGGLAQWLFLRDDIVSVTVSDADALNTRPNQEIAEILWRDIRGALGLDGELPPHRILKEKRATFAQTPEQVAKRPGPRTGLANVLLAGDWTATGLPATIEGAMRSGETAARLAG